MNEISKILGEKERIILQIKPNFRPYFAKSWVISIFGIIWLIFSLLPLLSKEPLNAYILIPFWIIGFLLTFTWPIYRIFNYNYTFYVITNKRAVKQEGVIGRDFESVFWNKLQNIQVNVGLFDKLLSKSSGTIQIFSAAQTMPLSFENAPEPYSLFRKIKEMSKF